MDKIEAAAFLGVSMRKLERLASSGRLTKGRARRKTRPCVVFDDKELSALKKELAASEPDRSTARVVKTLPPQGHVGFRLDPYYVEALAKAGKGYDMSPGEYARKLVIGAIESNSDGELLTEIRGIKSSLAARQSKATNNEEVLRELNGLKLGLASALREFALHFGMEDKASQEIIGRTLLKGWKRA